MARLIKRWSEITSSHGTCFYESSWVGKKMNHPDIASFVCYALLHAAVFVGFSCVWKEAFARRTWLSNKLCRARPVSSATDSHSVLLYL